jgi:1-acyl-sn-glycerol-3-phosphate acyltransferase
VVYNFLRILVGLFLRIFNRVETAGLGQIPKKGAAILVSNHRSNWDPVFIGGLVKRPVYYLAKAELFKNPFFSSILTRLLHAIPLKRGALDREALKRVSDLLKQGELILIFPEGRRSLTGEIAPFRPGAVMFAAKTNALLIPAAVSNTRNLFPSGFRRRVRLSVGTPVTLAEYSGKKLSLKDEDQISSRLRDDVAALLDRGGSG